jgi:hypothetical protein
MAQAVEETARASSAVALACSTAEAVQRLAGYTGEREGGVEEERGAEVGAEGGGRREGEGERGVEFESRGDRREPTAVPLEEWKEEEEGRLQESKSPAEHHRGGGEHYGASTSLAALQTLRSAAFKERGIKHTVGTTMVYAQQDRVTFNRSLMAGVSLMCATPLLASLWVHVSVSWYSYFLCLCFVGGDGWVYSTPI